MAMDWSTFIAQLERINRELRAPGKKGIGGLDARHKELSQSAADVFASIRDEAQIDVDHGNGAGDLIRRQVRTIRDYLAGLEKLADTMTGVEGDRQDAYDRTQPRDWYSRGARSMGGRKYNENHDPANGRFTSGAGAGTDDGSPNAGTGANFDFNLRDFEENHGIRVATASHAEIEAAMTKEWDDYPTDGTEEFLTALARRYGVKPPWTKSVSPPGAHKTYNGR